MRSRLNFFQRWIYTTLLVLLIQQLFIYAGEVAINGNGEPQVYVVKVHADWCGSCKALEPKLSELKNNFSNTSALFITLDVTDEDKAKQSRLLASALGMESLLKKNNKTGLVFVVNASDKKNAEVLTKKNSIEEFSTIIKKNLSIVE